MVLLLIEWLKGQLLISWNQRGTKEKQIVMELASIKFRQPIEINYGKNCTKRKRAWGLQHTIISKQNNANKSNT